MRVRAPICTRAHSCAPHRASVHRSGMIYSSESLLWSVKRARGIIEFGRGGSFRLVGWLTLGSWLTAGMMTDWVFCWLTARQAHWLHAGLQGWLPGWLIPWLNVLKTVVMAAHLLNINGQSSEQTGGQCVFCWALQFHSDTSCRCAAWNTFSSLQSPATDKASLSKTSAPHTFWALVHLWGNKNQDSGAQM